MARQKKIIPYVPQTKLYDPDDFWRPVWAARNTYTKQQILQWADQAQTNFYDNNPNANSYNRTSYSQFIPEKEARYGVKWDDLDGKGIEPQHGFVYPMLRSAFRASPLFDQMNDAFLAEYDSRADLQEVYQAHYKELYCYRDRWSKDVYNQGMYSYHTPPPGMETFIEDNKLRPSHFGLFLSVCDTHNARGFIEKNRPTPYEPGDLVKLRKPFIGHCDHDPYWISRYQMARDGSTMPDNTVDRIGTVMKVTDITNWRGSKGSKIIEVLWAGKEDATSVPEKVLKWEERPTKKNGMIK